MSVSLVSVVPPSTCSVWCRVACCTQKVPAFLRGGRAVVVALVACASGATHLDKRMQLHDPGDGNVKVWILVIKKMLGHISYHGSVSVE